MVVQSSYWVKAWSNGNGKAAGHGLSFSAADRDALLSRDLKTIEIRLGSSGTVATVNVDKRSFYKTSPYVISADIGRWLMARRYSPWPKGRPPQFRLLRISARQFELEEGADQVAAG